MPRSPLDTLRRHPVATFVALAYALSWYPWVLTWARRGAYSGPNPYGPLVASLIVSALVGGRRAVGEAAGRIVRWRVERGPYLWATLVPIAVSVLAAAITYALGARAVHRVAGADLADAIPRFVILLLFVGLGEEPGWRGFLQPTLERRLAPLTAALVVAPIWALWHLPLFGPEIRRSIVAPFLVGLTASSVLQAWLAGRCRGSVLPQMVYHATVNTVGAGLVFRLFADADLVRLWWVYSGIWVVTAAAVVRANRDELAGGAASPAGRGRVPGSVGAAA